jgi:hypothetical protein
MTGPEKPLHVSAASPKVQESRLPSSYGNAHSPALSQPAPLWRKSSNWPQDGWQLRLICRECDHWYIYEKKDVQWAPYTRPLAEETRVDFLCAELECAEPGCGLRTRWHVLDNSQMSETELLEFVLRADPVAVCENGHSFSISGTVSSSTRKVDSV